MSFTELVSNLIAIFPTKWWITAFLCCTLNAQRICMECHTCNVKYTTTYEFALTAVKDRDGIHSGVAAGHMHLSSYFLNEQISGPHKSNLSRASILEKYSICLIVS